MTCPTLLPPMTRKPSQTEHTLSLLDQQIRYIAVSEWQTLFDQEKPVGNVSCGLSS